MELLLYRWSTVAQIASSLTIAVFFVALARSVRRIELQPWVAAWLANATALAVTVAFWFAQPQSRAAFAVFIWGYMLPKTTFALLLAVGAAGFDAAAANRTSLTRRQIGATIAGTALAAAVIPSIDVLGAVQSAVIAAVLGAAAWRLFARPSPAVGWLATGFALRSALSAIESATYLTQIVPSGWSQSTGIRLFLAAQSSFDSGAEWVIALGCVLTLYRTIQLELTESNASLREAQGVLQQLADRDPLTGLSNRRALPQIFRAVHEIGATVLFFDLDAFKAINDRLGHAAGDRCLKRFARALQDSFRPDDHIVRYAGDEFVVIAPGSRPEQLVDCVDRVRERLQAKNPEEAQVAFSAGAAYLPTQGDGTAAINAADAAMYRDKTAARARLAVLGAGSR